MNEHCIEWRGYRLKPGRGATKGYGKTHRHILAHRWAYELFYGPIPKGHWVMHHCDNPPCINPFHLQAAPPAENMRDCARKGRNGKQRRTHCPRGHRLSGDNLLPHRLKRGHRVCRECKRIADRSSRKSSRSSAKRSGKRR